MTHKIWFTQETQIGIFSIRELRTIKRKVAQRIKKVGLVPYPVVILSKDCRAIITEGLNEMGHICKCDITIIKEDENDREHMISGHIWYGENEYDNGDDEIWEVR